MKNTRAYTRDDVFRLPKTDLHCHLDGCLRISTLKELAREQKVALPTTDDEALVKLLKPGKDCESLEDYLKAFDITLSVLQEKDALSRIAFELAEDAAAENVRYLEVRYSPILHLNKGLHVTEIVEAVLDGLAAARARYDILTGVIICGMRHISADVSVRLAELSAAYKHQGVVAFDLAGAEADHPAKAHRQAFFLMHHNNVNCTLHAGEAFGASSIAQAIHYCGAHRIGHGTRLREDRALLDYVNDHRIPLEICLTSNVQTRSVTRLEDHPLPFYYKYGVRVTLNTDNRLMSDTTVTDELYLAGKAFDLTLNDLKNIVINGFKSAFLPHRDKVRLLRNVLPDLGRQLL